MTRRIEHGDRSRPARKPRFAILRADRPDGKSDSSMDPDLQPSAQSSTGYRPVTRAQLHTRPESGAATGPAGQDLISEMSNSRVIFSETRTPPVSSAALKFTPQSLRLMTARPSKPARWLPYGSVASPVNSKSTPTGSVTSLM